MPSIPNTFRIQNLNALRFAQSCPNLQNLELAQGTQFDLGKVLGATVLASIANYAQRNSSETVVKYPLTLCSKAIGEVIESLSLLLAEPLAQATKNRLPFRRPPFRVGQSGEVFDKLVSVLVQHDVGVQPCIESAEFMATVFQEFCDWTKINAPINYPWGRIEIEEADVVLVVKTQSKAQSQWGTNAHGVVEQPIRPSSKTP